MIETFFFTILTICTFTYILSVFLARETIPYPFRNIPSEDLIE